MLKIFFILNQNLRKNNFEIQLKICILEKHELFMLHSKEKFSNIFDFRTKEQDFFFC